MNKPDTNHAAAPAHVPQPAEDVSGHIRRGLLLLAIITGLLLLFSWVIIHWDLDRAIAGRFYSPESGWWLRHARPWSVVYQYGTVPGLLLTLSALCGWFVCLAKPKLRHLHRYLLVVVLTAIIGPGVLVNGIIKNYWSRPRPRQVEVFGGQWQYRHITQPGIPGKGKSFPCGHCTMGFLFFSLVVFRRRRPWLALGGALTGILLGAFISMTRIVQGAHFPADCLWSAGIVLIVIVSLYYFVLQVPKPRRVDQREMSRSKLQWIGAGLAVAAIVITISFMLHRPFYETHIYRFKLHPDATQIVIRVDADIEKLTTHFQYRKSPQIIMEAWGFAWTDTSHDMTAGSRTEDSRQILELSVRKSGYFAELTHELNLYLPQKMKDRISVTLSAEGNQTDRQP